MRKVLGFKQWNLYAVSYRTRLALSVLRDYSLSIRSAVLDSVLPPNVRYDDQSKANRIRTLEILFRDCAADPICNSRYSKLKQHWNETLKVADRTVHRIAITGRSLEGLATKVFNGADLTNLLPLSDGGSLKNLPALLDAISSAKPGALKGLAQSASRSGNSAWGVRYSVGCSEELPFVSRKNLGFSASVVSSKVCQAWGVLPVRDEVLKPIVSGVPILLISGEYDPETPPSWAAEAAKTLSNAESIVFRVMSHAPTQEWAVPCPMQFADRFLQKPEVPIDRSCSSEMRWPIFELEKK